MQEVDAKCVSVILKNAMHICLDLFQIRTFIIAYHFLTCVPDTGERLEGYLLMCKVEYAD